MPKGIQGFQKGMVPWNKGIKHSDKTKDKIRQKAIGRKQSGEAIEKNRLAHLREKNHNWKGGSCIDKKKGYRLIYYPTHPYAHKNYVYEHRLVMEKHLGRYLTPKEHIHHIDGNGLNNKLENLKLTNNKKHQTEHRLKREKNNYPYKYKGKEKEWYEENKEKINKNARKNYHKRKNETL